MLVELCPNKECWVLKSHALRPLFPPLGLCGKTGSYHGDSRDRNVPVFCLALKRIPDIGLWRRKDNDSAMAGWGHSSRKQLQWWEFLICQNSAKLTERSLPRIIAVWDLVLEQQGGVGRRWGLKCIGSVCFKGQDWNTRGITNQEWGTLVKLYWDLRKGITGLGLSCIGRALLVPRNGIAGSVAGQYRGLLAELCMWARAGIAGSAAGEDWVVLAEVFWGQEMFAQHLLLL